MMNHSFSKLPETVYYSFKRHRIGDKIAVSASFRWLKSLSPQTKIIVVDDNESHQGRQSTIPSSVIFSHLIDGVADAVPEGVNPIHFGSHWIRTPWLAKQGIYPSIQVDSSDEAELFYRFSWMGKPYVCVHILEDAGYNIRRNHNFGSMQSLISLLSRKGYQVVRIGKPLGRLAKDCIDLSELNLTIMQSACVIKNCRAFVGGDTGMTHIAAALDIPLILAIYGNLEGQDPRWKKLSKRMGCFPLQDNFCSLPNIKPEKLKILEMRNHAFDPSVACRMIDSHLKQDVAVRTKAIFHRSVRKIGGVADFFRSGFRRERRGFALTDEVTFPRKSDTGLLLVGRQCLQIDQSVIGALRHLPMPKKALLERFEKLHSTEGASELLSELLSENIIEEKRILAKFKSKRKRHGAYHAVMTFLFVLKIVTLRRNAIWVSRLRKTEYSPSNRILVINYGGIGDMVLTTPLLREISNSNRGLEIDVLCKAKYASFFDGCPYISKVIAFSGIRSFFKLNLDPHKIAQGLYGKYAITIGCMEHFGGSLRWFYGKAMAVLIDAPIRIGTVDRVMRRYPVLTKDFLTNEFPEKYEHEAQRILSYLSPLGISPISGDLGLWHSNTISAQCGFKREAIIGIAPFTSANKCWPIERWASLINRIHLKTNEKVVIFGSKADVKEAALLAFLARAPCINLAGRTNLPDLMQIVSRMKVVISTDTGIAHIAAAYSIKQIVLYGFSNQHRYSPWKNEKAVVFRKRSKKIEDISLDEVFEAVLKGVLQERGTHVDTLDEVCLSPEMGESIKKILGSYAYAIVVKSKNGLFVVDPEDQFVGARLRKTGQYGLHEVERIKSRIAIDSRVLNVGAHIGTLAIPLSKHCKEVVAVEANPLTYELLTANILLNTAHNIKTINIAASDKEENIEFLLSRENTGGSKRVPQKKRSMYYYDNPRQITIKAAGLDDHLLEKDFDIVIMDIEGSEYFALTGMQEILSKCKVLVVEFLPHHLKNVSGVTVEQFLSVIDPHFNRLTIPSKGLVLSSSEFVSHLTEMYNCGQGDAGIIFEKV
jgi:FkbM family methyltransferase